MKAFLSHTSSDKDFVRRVADELGRQYCIFDEQSFQSNDEFVITVRKGLDRTTAFVLFASREALESCWVQFEVHEAEYRQIQRNISRILVYLVGPGVTHSDLPTWMQRCLVRSTESPRSVAREIRHAVDQVLRESVQPFFVGRTGAVREFEEALRAPDGKSPRIMAAYGLSGIGRRTLLARVGHDQWSLPRSLAVQVASGDSIRDIAVKLGFEFEPIVSAADARAFAERIAAASELVAEGQALKAIRAAVSNGELPVLIDDGGILQDDATLTAPMASLLAKVYQTQGAYAGLVLGRRPAFGPNLPVACARVDPLSADDVKLLIQRIAERQELTLSSAESDAMAQTSAGYPPAAYYSVTLAKHYGASTILAFPEPLIRFRADFFLRKLQASLKLTSTQRAVLAALAYYSPLPVPVLGTALGIDPNATGQALMALIDLMLVTPDGHQMRVSVPVADAIRRFIPVDDVPHVRLATAIAGYLDNCEPEDRHVALLQCLYRAKRWAGEEKDSPWALRFASDLLELARRAYNEQEYERAVGYAGELLELRPTNRDARELLTRALIKQERYEEAEEALRALQASGFIRSHCFLQGFLHRHRDEHAAAVNWYEDALGQGQRGVAVHRELALCYFILGRIDEARKHIDEAKAADPSNRFVVDLQIKIATLQRDDVGARKMLETLADIDSRPFYKHRKSTVDFAFGRTRDALDAARDAVTSAKRPSFEMLSQLIKCQIAEGTLREAGENLRRLDATFPGSRADIRIGLRCKWEIARKQYANALGLWDGLRRKDLPVHRALRRDALEGLLADGVVVAAERRRLEADLEVLREALKDNMESWPEVDAGRDRD